MSTMEVRIIRLEPLYVASALGYGSNPEELAWNNLLDWIKASGLDRQIASHRFFGFNNPNPSVGSPNYGYEQWVTVDAGTPSKPDEVSGEEITIKEFSGGLYAVTRCRLSRITDAWKELVTWRERSRYKPAHHPCLEECLGKPLDQAIGMETEFDLYLPIRE